MADNTISPVVPNVSGGRNVSTGQKAVTQTAAQSGIDFKSYLGGRTAVQDNSTTFLKRRNSYTLNKNNTKEISIKTASKNSPTESEVKKITDDISSQIVEKVTDDLDISEDELNNAMQLLGLTAMDLLNSMYMDVLKEIGNIGAGNATTAIAGMLGTTMKMEVPRVLLMDATKLGDAICPEEETIVGIFLEVTNDISGSMMFLMKLPAAHFLVNKLMGRPQDYNEPFDEMDLSAMKEIGNIIAGAYLSALSTMTNLKILPSIPYIAVDMAASILSVPAIQFGQYGDNALFIETEFGDDIMMNGYFILMPDPDSYDNILSALGISF